MLTYNDKIYVSYRKQELEHEVRHILLTRAALDHCTMKPYNIYLLLAGIGRKLVLIGSWLEKRFDALSKTEPCADPNNA